MGDSIYLIFHARDTTGQPYKGKLPDGITFWSRELNANHGHAKGLPYDHNKRYNGGIDYESDDYLVEAVGPGILYAQYTAYSKDIHSKSFTAVRPRASSQRS